MATSIIIKYTDATLKKYQKAVPNVSDSATDAELYNFAYDFLALSTYTFSEAQKVSTTTLPVPTGGSGNE